MGAAFDGRNTFYLGEFDGAMEEALVVPLLDVIKDQSLMRCGKIDMYISSVGGDASIAWHVVRMIELAKSYGIEVRTMVTSGASSAGSIIAVAGTPGERYIDKNAFHITHYGATDLGVSMTPKQAHRQNEYSQRHFKRVLDHYNTYCNIPDIEEHISDDDWYITAAQAKRWGMADQYLDKLSIW